MLILMFHALRFPLCLCTPFHYDITHFLLLLFFVQLFLAFLAERVLAFAADFAALLALPATLLAACAVLVVILLAASASFLTRRLFSRAPFLIVFCVDGALAFFPRLPPGMTVWTTRPPISDTAFVALPATLDA